MPPKPTLIPTIYPCCLLPEVLKSLGAPQTRPHSLPLPMSPFAGPSLETHTVSRIRAVPPQENPKSHPSDARTTNSAAQGTNSVARTTKNSRNPTFSRHRFAKAPARFESSNVRKTVANSSVITNRKRCPPF